jgi:hypothetical protein
MGRNGGLFSSRMIGDTRIECPPTRPEVPGATPALPSLHIVTSLGSCGRAIVAKSLGTLFLPDRLSPSGLDG